MMRPRRPASISRLATLALALATTLAASARSPLHTGLPVSAAGHWREASLDDYRHHLAVLSGIVQACARARDLATCDPLLVGPDDRIIAGADRRLIRYGWLRVLLSQAESPDEPPARTAAPAHPGAATSTDNPPPPPSTSQLLQQALARLAFDLAQVNSLAAEPPSPNYAYQRGVLQQVLAGNDFRGLRQTSVRDTMLEKFNGWLNRLLEGAARYRARSAWVGRLIVWGFVLAVCVGLVWGLLQLERRWRIRLVPAEDLIPAGSASARDWQHWLDDARRAAASGQWRQAIHALYWAAIARLESRRLWPADRARTPREYLALIAPDDPRRAGLVQLTRSFERTWYGGRAASESDYRQAQSVADHLIAGGSSAQGGAA